MKIKIFQASNFFLANIIKRYNDYGLLVFRDNKSIIKLFMIYILEKLLKIVEGTCKHNDYYRINSTKFISHFYKLIS